jgi:2'-5' RNA ligase
MTERLFIALTLPAPVRASLAALSSTLPGVTWTPEENLHLTLRFVGQVSEETYEKMRKQLAGVRIAAFILPLEGIGSFPPTGPARVIWIGVGRGHPRLFQLRQQLDDALLAAGLNLEVRNFHPHATLARCREDAGPRIASWLRAHRDFEAPPFSVESFTVFTSTAGPDGRVYEVKQNFPLDR